MVSVNIGAHALQHPMMIVWMNNTDTERVTQRVLIVLFYVCTEAVFKLFKR